jgi:sialidase-1
MNIYSIIRTRIPGMVNPFQIFRLVAGLTLCLIILIYAGCNTKSDNHDNEVVFSLEPGNNNPRNSEGDFITLKDGKILFIYSHYTGASGHDDSSAYLAGRYSSDNGKTWTHSDVKIVEQEKGIMNVMSVSLLRLQNEEIAFFYLKKNSMTDVVPMIKISSDEAKTWSEPSRCITNTKGYFNLNNNRLIQLKNGRILLPVSLHRTPKGVWGPESSLGHIYNYFSDDNGRSWKSGVEVSNPDSIITQEPGVIELKNGDILLYMRTTSGVQYFSWSKDKGETWSQIEPGNLKSPCSPATIARIPSTGDLLVVWNDNGIDQKRTPLNIAVSKDDGKTWINNKIIENDPNGSYCYTAIHFTDKDVLLGYCAGNSQNGTDLAITHITKLSLDWIYK